MNMQHRYFIVASEWDDIQRELICLGAAMTLLVFSLGITAGYLLGKLI